MPTLFFLPRRIWANECQTRTCQRPRHDRFGARNRLPEKGDCVLCGTKVLFAPPLKASLMTRYDSEEQIWTAEDPLFPGIRVVASTRENAERDLKLLKTIKLAKLVPIDGH